MRLDSVIYLQRVVGTNDDSLSTKQVFESRKTFASKKSVRQSEFYQAASTGLKPELTFVIWTTAYKGETRLIYGNHAYSVIRSFERADNMIELTCEVKMGD